MLVRGIQRIRIAWDLAAFGHRLADRIRIVMLVVGSPVLRRLGVPRTMSLRLDLNGHLIGWTATTDADLIVLDQIFKEIEYDVSEHHRGRTRSIKLPQAVTPRER